ncbi:hypothetical protein Leryth_026330 [Lithospermum erythrorhizon]|nr:hypothetical protein Leryth_026330 [Lithospermum erythrorhizon]
MAKPSTSATSSPPPPPPFGVSGELPLRLLRSEIIPPAPNTDSATASIDWIPDFSGYAWVAYGAASLLVISHFPNPISQTEPLIAPFLKQVLELNGSGSVSAVSWSPVMPSSGDLAASVDNIIKLFSFDHSSFVWRQTVTLLQTTNVESIKWTSSGDGIIAGGLEVVLWRKKEMTWEIAWKVKAELPHSLVSASWSIEGPSASAPSGNLHIEDPSSSYCDSRKCVLVCYGVGNSQYQQVNLLHPMPVSMIQWRPSIIKRQKRVDGPISKSVLLTCCLDGSVRLWSEVDDIRIRKTGKVIGDHKMTRSSFRVVASIDVDQPLRGVLGSNLFVRWASEIDAIVTLAKKANHYTSSDDHIHVEAGRCDWLIGFGSDNKMVLWAIHCLDDHAPLRYPRVTLWKTHELVCSEGSRSMLLLDKAFIMRTRSSGPPEICSFIVLSHNTLSWELYSPNLLNLPDETDNHLSLPTKEVLNIDSHTGKILQVALHPYLWEIEIAASLDSNGMLLLWSLSTASHSIMGMPTLNSVCKYSGNYKFTSSTLKYTSLAWTPVLLDENSILATGHREGIDLLMMERPEKKSDSFVLNKLCTIPLVGHLHGQAPADVWTIPFPLASDDSFLSSNFLLIAVWKKDFHALSWKISVHHCVSLENKCACGFEITNSEEKIWYTFKGILFGKHVYISARVCSSVFPDLYKFDVVSSFAVLSPRSVMSSNVGNVCSANQMYKNYPAYHMVTGCADGSLKLWRSVQNESSSLEWDLVGIHSTHQGSVSKVCPSCCGQMIATVSSTDVSNKSTVMIWESVNLAVAGGFMLEDTLCVDGEVVSINWLMMGNGMAVLGVCLKYELQVYAQKHSGVLGNLTSDTSLKGSSWVCIAVSPTRLSINDFFWGSKAMPILVHDKYFCFFSHFLFRSNEVQLSFKDSPYSYRNGFDKHKSPVICDPYISNDENSLDYDLDRKNVCSSSIKLVIEDDFPSIMKVLSSNKKYNSGPCKYLYSLIEVVEQLSGRLSIFQPEALLINICSGNWRRAHVVMQHLSKHINSQDVFVGGHCSGRPGFFTPLVPLSTYFDGAPPSYTSPNSFKWSSDANLFMASSQLENGSSQHFSMLGNSSLGNASLPSQKSDSSDFIDTVDKLFDAAVVTHTEKLQLCAIIDLLKEISNQDVSSPYGSLDEPGRRFWASVRFQRLYFSEKCGRHPTAGELIVHSKLIGWAYHSDCQENLFDSLLSSEPSWEEMRDIGIGYWYTNAAQLRMKMEKLARRQYLKSKDPKACALIYIALNRIQVLAGLFKISKDDKDKPWVGFLSRNFQEEKNKAAAVKNAYVLMGKHQLELAVAFFLLGGDSTSAITVCAKNLGDVQLALVLCRLVDGYRGPLEHHLVSKFLIPSVLSDGDFWLASILELMIGNHSQAILTLFGLQGKSMSNKKSAISFNQASFLDPSVGQYCLMLATRTSMKNAIGDQSAGILGRWSVLMTTRAFSRCGLPLEALECLSSLHNMFSGSTQSSILEVAEPIDDILKLLPCTSPSNWISSEVACNIQLQTKSDLAVQYMAILLSEHPSWQDNNIVACTSAEFRNKEFHISLEKFQVKWRSSLTYFEQKLSLVPLYIVNKIVIYLFNSGLHSIGCFILCSYISEKFPLEKSVDSGCSSLGPVPCKLLLEMTREVSCMLSRYILVCSINSPKFRYRASDSLAVEEGHVWGLYRWSLIWLLRFLRATLNMYSSSHSSEFSFYVLDIFEYYVYFATAWSERNFRVLILLLKPLVSFFEENELDTDVRDLNGTLLEVAKMLAHDPLIEAGFPIPINEQIEHEQGANIVSLVPEDERWQLISASLWTCMAYFLKKQMGRLRLKLKGLPSLELAGKLSSMTMSDASHLDAAESHIRLISDLLDKFIYQNLSHMSLYSAKQFVSYLISKEDISNATILLCSNNNQTPTRTEQEKNSNQVEEDMMHYPKKPAFETLWDICSSTKFISKGLLQENYDFFRFVKKSFRGWSFTYANIMEKCEPDKIFDKEDTHGSPHKEERSPRACLAPNDHPFLSSSSKGLNGEKRSAAPFHNHRDIYKRNGELFEALCINSIDQQEAALASNRKGLLFFKFEAGMPSRCEPEYIWSKADWPYDGWAGSDFTPIPTCVSPGVGLGSNKGKHFGLGGATVGAASQVRLGSDIVGGGASGIRGHAGMSLPNLGWGTEEEFDEFMDPPASADNVRTRSLTAHPSRPLLLVGSSNTHIYLWEFGKDKATATYGVLPAANVPPPYALASISSVCFDRCGHRFVTGALDGTVCTWQLEVGGRSNIRPTEFSSCFDNHTSEVSYVTASGSIVAAAGYGSNGINVVVWDTLAPPTTSRASIMCHEGGARSLAVFDNNIGSGSISPLIVTGGRDGDVGVHDFRYIATGRAKRQKHPDSTEQNNQSSTVNMRNKTGDQNRNGMLWYIPKAHSGTVTKITTIPHTSFFLTGSKDGDVKLWDAKQSRLVFHWPKLHERHTFLQPNSRGFGGVVRAGVTDIQVITSGFLSCGGDGAVKMVELEDFSSKDSYY